MERQDEFGEQRETDEELGERRMPTGETGEEFEDQTGGEPGQRQEEGGRFTPTGEGETETETEEQRSGFSSES